MARKHNPKKQGKALTARGEATRKRLLATAIRLFARRGLHGVSVDEVVETARINKRMVYHYFGSKEDLYRACLIEVYRRLEALESTILAPGLRPDLALERILEAYFEFLAKNPEFVRLILWENLNEGAALAKYQSTLSKAPLHRHLQEVVARGARDGLFRRNLDVDFLSISLIGLCFIYYSNQYTLSQAMDLDLLAPKTRRRALAFARQFLLHGVMATSPTHRR